MRTVTKISIAAIIIYYLFQAGVNAYAKESSFLRLRDGRVVSFEEMMDDIKDSKLIFAGEYHDNKVHHGVQLDIIKKMNALKPSIAVGAEMFERESQDYLNKWVKGDIRLDDFVPLYYKNWSEPWTLYNDIFLYLRDNKIPLIGLNLSKDVLNRVEKTGVSSLTKEGIKELPADGYCYVDMKYMDFIRRVYAIHGHQKRNVETFCLALLLKDRVMAQGIAEYLKKNQDKTLIVLSGVNHAWKKGVPVQIGPILKEVRSTVILLGAPVYTGAQTFTADDADYVLLK